MRIRNLNINKFTLIEINKGFVKQTMAMLPLLAHFCSELCSRWPPQLSAFSKHRNDSDSAD